MTSYEIEEQDKAVLIGEVSRLTQAAVDAGRSYTVRMSRDGKWWKAVVQIEEVRV